MISPDQATQLREILISLTREIEEAHPAEVVRSASLDEAIRASHKILADTTEEPTEEEVLTSVIRVLRQNADQLAKQREKLDPQILGEKLPKLSAAVSDKLRAIALALARGPIRMEQQSWPSRWLEIKPGTEPDDVSKVRTFWQF